MTSRQLSEWLAYYQLRPFGEEADDIRAAKIAQSLYAVNCSKRSQIPDLRTFMPPKYDPAQEKESKLANIKSKFLTLAEKRKNRG